MEAPTIIWFPLILLLLLLLPKSMESLDCQRQLENDMDPEEEPCENFHQHACGNWYANSVQRSLGAHDMRSKWVANLKLQLNRHLESSQEAQSTQLGTFYRSCLSSGQSVRSFTDALAQSGANFTLLANNSAGAGGSFDWTLANAALRTYGAQGLWRLLVQDNWQSAEQRIFYILPPTFGLLGNGDEMDEFLYERYLKVLLMELGLRVRRSAQLARKLVDFERSLRSLLPSDRDQKLVLRKPQSLSDLELQLPNLELRRYFEIILQGLEGDPSALLVVADLDYLQGLEKLLAREDAGDPLVLSTWLLLQLPVHFELKLHDDEKLSSQRDRCLEQLRKLMPGPLGVLQMQLVLGANYQQVYDNAVQQIAQLFRNLKLQFELRLNETEVFAENLVTRNLARDKLRAMRLLTPRLQDPAGHAAAVGLAAATPLGGNCDENLMRLSLDQARLEFRQVFGEPVTSAPADPLAVNAYYRLKLNRIELPLGLLATPLAQLPCSPPTGEAAGEGEGEREGGSHHLAKMSAGLGYILAHEMVHAFDYDGINYDAAGQLANGQWPSRAIIRFGMRASCYLGVRYSNATLTINENIADSEGLRLALDTYRQRNSTANLRAFFVAFAQNWCGAAASPGLGQHATHAERVNNVLGNLPEFGDAFQCKASSRMNPAEKCRIW
ncbi:endothelin-converting enzyme 2 [Drosophila ficusphila]|uniref:endothelin-converting enzyme 2 n=1 Tax=Drosophila ficusphila TaxID=30025 RepID=UPI0007E8572B|nr:endothelin-converting enzyme 2 [Drosophila ficusphila]